MQIKFANKNDALQLSYVIQRLYVFDQLSAGLKMAGIQFEGPAFDNRLTSNAWLETVAKDVARIYQVEVPENIAGRISRRKSSNESPEKEPRKSTSASKTKKKAKK